MATKMTLLLAWLLLFGCGKKSKITMETTQNSDKTSGNEEPSQDQRNTESSGSNGVDKAIKFVEEGCIDPDLSLLHPSQTITLCDGTLAQGNLKLCENGRSIACFNETTEKLADSDESEICIDPDLNIISESAEVSMCDGSTASGLLQVRLPECTQANQKECSLTGANFVAMDVSERDQKPSLKESDFVILLGSEQSFQYWDAQGNRHTGMGDSNLKPRSIEKDIEILGVTGIYTGHPNRPLNLSATLLSGTEIRIDWQNEGQNYLLVVGQNKEVIFEPENGASFVPGAAGLETIVYVGDGNTYTQNTGIIIGTDHHYALYAFDELLNYSPVSRTIAVTKCGSLPGDWVYIEADADLGTSEFCVMKYEAKNVSSAPRSQPELLPWTNITQADAKTQCEDISPGNTRLVSNSEWLAISADIFSLSENWSGPGGVGDGWVAYGHADGDPNQACAASSNTSLSYVEGSCNPIGASEGENAESSTRRTNLLPLGEVIWDFAGNVWEWTSYDNENGKPTPASGAWVEFTSLTSGTNTTLDILLPTAKSFWNATWDSSQGIGRFWTGDEGVGGTMIRGGYWNAGSISGVLAGRLRSPSANAERGFRCTATPP